MNSTITKSKWLILREIYSLFIRVFASFFLMKLIGPKEYGMYISAVNVITFATAVSQMGVNVFLVKETRCADTIKQSFTFSLVCSIIATFICYALTMLFFKGLITIFLVLIPVIIIGNLRVTSLGILEKNVDYKKISIIELNTQIIFYIASFFLYTYGSIGLGISYLLSILYNSTHTFFSSPIPICLKMPSKKMIKFGITYSFSNLCLQSKNLINILLMPIVGATNVGKISFAMKLCDGANIIKDTTRRVSLKTFSSKNFSINSVNKAILFQVFSVSSIMIFIIFILPFISIAMGKNWCDKQDLVLFTAIFYSINSFFTIQYFFLTIKEKNIANGFYLLLQNTLIIVVTKLLFNSMDVYAYGVALITANVAGVIPILQLKSHKLSYKKPIFYLLIFISLAILSKFIWWSPILSLCLIFFIDTKEILSFLMMMFFRRVKIENN